MIEARITTKGIATLDANVAIRDGNEIEAMELCACIVNAAAKALADDDKEAKKIIKKMCATVRRRAIQIYIGRAAQNKGNANAE